MNPKGWIGVDFDGTLATYTTWKGAEVLGEPILPMVQRVMRWRQEGKNVRIMTARAFPLMGCLEPETLVASPLEGTGTRDQRIEDAVKAVHAIRSWCKVYLGEVLPITCVKDYGMIELWDDRAVQVVNNMGHPVPGQISRAADGQL